MDNMSENGVQRLSDIIVEQRSEEDTPMLHLELEDSEDANIHEININQSEEMAEDVQDMVNNRYLFNCKKYNFSLFLLIFFKLRKEHLILSLY